MKLGKTALSYISSACNKVKNKRAREELRAELTSHLEETVERLVMEGYAQERAEFKAVSRMGDPRTVSGKMNKVYSPVLYTIVKYFCLAATCALFLLNFAPLLFFGNSPGPISDVGVIGGADGPTAIYVTTKLPFTGLFYIFLFATLFLFLFPVIKDAFPKKRKR